MHFSVVIPCRNAEQWLAGALDSVEAQTFQPEEILVIDDGSTDNSVKLVERNYPHVKLLHSERRNGASARNIGIKESVSDWVAFLDADDVWYPNHLERICTAAATGDLACANVFDHIFADSADVRSNPPSAPWPSELMHGLTGVDFINRYTQSHWFPGMSGLAFERNRLIECGMLDETQLRRHDIDLWLRFLAGSATWTFDARPTSAYRVDTPGAISRNKASKEWYLLRAMLNNRENYGEDIEPLVRSCSRRALAAAYTDGSRSDIAAAIELAMPHVSWMNRWLFSLTRCCPRVLGFFNRLRRIWIKRKQ